MVTHLDTFSCIHIFQGLIYIKIDLKSRCKHSHTAPPSTSTYNRISICHFDLWWDLNMVIWPHGHKCTCRRLIKNSSTPLLCTHRHTFTLPYSEKFILNEILFHFLKCKHSCTTPFLFLGQSLHVSLWYMVKLEHGHMRTWSEVDMLVQQLSSCNLMHIDTPSFTQPYSE